MKRTIAIIVSGLAVGAFAILFQPILYFGFNNGPLAFFAAPVALAISIVAVIGGVWRWSKNSN